MLKSDKMNLLKNVCFFAFLLVGMSYSTHAQSVLSPAQQEQVIENVTTFINDLNLSERDKPAFRAIVEDFFIGLVALRATNFPANTNQKILKALVKGRDSRAKDLLSAEQFKVYKAQLKETRANIRTFMERQR